MIRRFSLSFFLLILVHVGYSQILIALVFGDKLNSDKLEFGLNVGANYSNISNLEYEHSQRGLNLGMTFVYKLSKNFHINPALYFSFPMGARGLEIYTSPDSNLNKVIEKATLQRQLSYFSLPIAFRYRVFGRTFIEAGPQVSLLNRGKDIFEIEIEDGGDLTYEVNLRDKYTLFDAGITAGITHNLREQNGVCLTFRYYYGLVDVSKDELYPNQKNSAF